MLGGVRRMARCFRRLRRGDRGRFLLVEREAKVRWLVCAVRRNLTFAVIDVRMARNV